MKQKKMAWHPFTLASAIMFICGFPTIQAQAGQHDDRPSAHVIKRLAKGEAPLKFTFMNESGSEDAFDVATILIQSAQSLELIQRIELPCREGTLDLQQQRKSARRHNPARGGIEFADYNFDGYLDMQVLCDMATNGTFTIWLYDQASNRFITNDSMVFSTPSIDRKNKRVISESHCCGGSLRNFATYAFIGDRFQVQSARHVDCDPAFNRDEPICKETYTHYLEGRKVSEQSICYLKNGHLKRKSDWRPCPKLQKKSTPSAPHDEPIGFTTPPH